jgi:hypothetical protein
VDSSALGEQRSTFRSAHTPPQVLCNLTTSHPWPHVLVLVLPSFRNLSSSCLFVTLSGSDKDAFCQGCLIGCFGRMSDSLLGLTRLFMTRWVKSHHRFTSRMRLSVSGSDSRRSYPLYYLSSCQLPQTLARYALLLCCLAERLHVRLSSDRLGSLGS